MELTHDEIFALTPFQFQQLYEGWVERERISAIKRAEMEAVIFNANRIDESQKAIGIKDILPWFEDYLAGRKAVQQETEYVEYPQRRQVDLSVPQLERVTKRLLEDKGFDPDEVKRDSPEWQDAEKIATACITGATGIDGAQGMEGFTYRKADPTEWGTPPWEDEDEES